MDNLNDNNLNDVESKLKEELRENLLNGGFGIEADCSVGESGGANIDKEVDKFISLFGSKEDTPFKGHDWVVNLPSSIMDKPSGSNVPLYGIVRTETESVYVLDYDKYRIDPYFLGTVFVVNDGGAQNDSLERTSREQASDGDFPSSYRLSGTVINGVPDLRLERRTSDGGNWENVPFRIRQYDGITNLFSRNSGLLESADMLGKTAVLVGCGSVGSLVALELARSGVGRFILCDSDTLEIHNICRHQCGFDDLGRYKVDAVKDKILNINPKAEVITYKKVIQEVPIDSIRPFLGSDSVIIGGGDNRYSADCACRIAVETGSSFVATCCWTRAFAGEVFYWTPTLDRSLSCYSCAFKELIDDARPESHSTYFGEDSDRDALAFEPGVAVDIDFVTIIGIKVALDLINRNNPNYTPRVINDLKQLTWICNTNSPRIGGERAMIFPEPLWITRNLIPSKDEHCPYCGGNAND